MSAKPPATMQSTALVSRPREVFKDPFAIERLDDRENYGADRFIVVGADRFIVVGMVEGRLLFSPTP